MNKYTWDRVSIEGHEHFIIYEKGIPWATVYKAAVDKIEKIVEGLNRG